LLASVATRVLAVDGESAGPESYFVVVTGGELLRGVYPDGHTWYLARALQPLGLQCVGSLCVGDEAEPLRRALAFASSRAALIIVTGGLGPTDDDITRETVADFTGIELQEDSGVLAALARRSGSDAGALPANLRRQARTPTGGRWLANPHGSAVGLVFDDRSRVVVALPGPPRELRPMVRDALIPFLRQRYGLRTFGSSATVRFVGIGESQIDQTLHDRIQLPTDLVISSIFEAGRVDLSFFLPGNSAMDRGRMARLMEEVRGQLGDRIYATDGRTLEDVVLSALSASGRSLWVAEVGTGGAVAVSLNRSPIAETMVAGGWSAPSRRALRTLASLPWPMVDAGVAGPGDAGFAIETVRSLAHRQPGGVALVTDTARDPEPGKAEGGRRLWAAFGPWEDDEVLTHEFAVGGKEPEQQARLVTSMLDWLHGIVRNAGDAGGETRQSQDGRGSGRRTD
jgi:nicotinamide-nucleotide amidase